MAKKVFDRIWKTVTIIFNTIWTVISMAFGICVLFTDSYSRSDAFEGWIMSMVVVILVNAIDWITRRYLKNY